VAEALARFRFSWDELPALTADLPGSGGLIRTAIDDFMVSEVPLYEPSGTGSHAYALVEKRGLTTKDLVVALGQAGVNEKNVGVAGLKDKYALTRQWLSVPNASAGAFEALEGMEGVVVLARSRHKNKLAIGHLRGNLFEIRVREAEASKAQAILERLRALGLPNYFGPQRFGRFGSNAVDGFKLLRGEAVSGDHRLKRFFVSALQSHLFNHLLAMRLRRGIFNKLVRGDWAKKHDTGGVFLVEDAEAESPRAERFAVSATVPLYGKKVKESSYEAGELEREIMAYFGLSWLDFRGRHGDRRLSRIKLEDATLIPHDDGYTVKIFLPKGVFATSLLRELMKVEVDAPLEDEVDAS
jgi:tRNA pseudouridine13 synthase